VKILDPYNPIVLQIHTIAVAAAEQQTGAVSMILPHPRGASAYTSHGKMD